MGMFPSPLRWLVLTSAIGLFLCSSLKHFLFYSNAYDLAYFDQILYRLSQGQSPVIGPFAPSAIYPIPWILYPIAGLYAAIPSV